MYKMCYAREAVIVCVCVCVCVCAALIFSPLESVLARGRGVEDSLNSVAAATLTGVLYRSTGVYV